MAVSFEKSKDGNGTSPKLYIGMGALMIRKFEKFDAPIFDHSCRTTGWIISDDLVSQKCRDGNGTAKKCLKWV